MTNACLIETDLVNPSDAGEPSTLITAPTRVLHVINGEHYAGAERVQDLLALHLGEHGYEVGLASLKPGQFASARQARHAPLHEVEMHGRLDFSVAWRLARIIRREGYRLIHSHTARSAMVAGLVSVWTGVPMVHHVHSHALRDTAHPWRNRLNALAERIALRRASALIAVSASLGRRMIQQGFAAHRVFVVPNGVTRRPTIPARPAGKRDWTLGTMALFRPRKGIEVLLDALTLLRRQGFPARLRAVGGFETPEYERQTRQLAADLGLTEAIDWTGFTRDVDAELARMDLFVLPSLFGEGLPMVVLEAMAAGVPIVATRVEGTPEAVRDGCEGLIVEPGDSAGLAQAIARILRGEVCWHALHAAALRRHAEQFSDARMTAGVADVYRRVLDKRCSAAEDHGSISAHATLGGTNHDRAPSPTGNSS